jgi:hypothetical protein
MGAARGCGAAGASGASAAAPAERAARFPYTLIKKNLKIDERFNLLPYFGTRCRGNQTVHTQPILLVSLGIQIILKV